MKWLDGNLDTATNVLLWEWLRDLHLITKLIHCFYKSNSSFSSPSYLPPSSSSPSSNAMLTSPFPPIHGRLSSISDVRVLFKGFEMCMSYVWDLRRLSSSRLCKQYMQHLLHLNVNGMSDITRTYESSQCICCHMYYKFQVEQQNIV